MDNSGKVDSAFTRTPQQCVKSYRPNGLVLAPVWLFCLICSFCVQSALGMHVITDGETKTKGRSSLDRRAALGAAGPTVVRMHVQISSWRWEPRLAAVNYTNSLRTKARDLTASAAAGVWTFVSVVGMFLTLRGCWNRMGSPTLPQASYISTYIHACIRTYMHTDHTLHYSQSYTKPCYTHGDLDSYVQNVETQIVDRPQVERYCR